MNKNYINVNLTVERSALPSQIPNIDLRISFRGQSVGSIPLQQGSRDRPDAQQKNPTQVRKLDYSCLSEPYLLLSVQN